MAKDEEHAELNAVGLITDVKTNADKGAAAEAQNTEIASYFYTFLLRLLYRMRPFLLNDGCRVYGHGLHSRQNGR